MAPIPVALCGKNPSMARSFVDAVNDAQYEGNAPHLSMLPEIPY
jgi:hypothetical protein